MVRISRLAGAFLLVLAIANVATATVYVNRNYYWYEPAQEWRYTIVDRHYTAGTATNWNLDSDFGLQGVGSPYVLEADVYVDDGGGTLNVTSGVVVKIPQGRGIYVSGTLNAQGSEGSHITFTSTQSAPAPGAWDEILIHGAEASSSVLRYCDIAYGGSGAYHAKIISWHYARGNILVRDCAPTIDHCTSSYSANYGFYGLGACQATISDSTFSSNGSYGIAVFDSSYYQAFGGTLPVRGCAIMGNGYGTYSSAQAAGAFDATNDISGNTHNVCQIYASTTQTDVTWHRMQGGPVWELVGDVYSLTPNSLTIQAGNVIKFDSTRSLYVTGTLTAVGSGSERIYFTSIKDDTVGGDSNADGNATAPAPGDWSEVLLANSTSSGSQLEYCVLRYGGSNRYDTPVIGWHYMRGNIVCYASAPTFRNCVSSDSGVDGATLKAGSTPAFENVALDGCGQWAMWCEDIASNPVVTNCSASGNGRNGIRIPGGTVPVTRTWYKSVPYVVQGEVYVAWDRGLTINSGTVVKFDGNSALYVNGSLQAVGTPGEPIYFTSLMDDAAGGDTNGDGGDTSPAPGDWREVCVYGDTATPSQLEHCTLRYGGNNAYVPAGIGWHHARGNILVKDCAPTIDHCTSSQSANYGFYGLGACQATISDSTFSGSPYGMVLGDSSYYQPFGTTLPIRGCSITGNGYGTHSSAQAAGAFDATNDVSGNTHNVCQIYASTTQTDVTWRRMQGGPVWELVGDVYSLTPNSLTMQAGNVIKFNSPYSIYVTGTLTAVGTPASRIYFTSIKDDAVGGDSNADGNATAPARGDWSEVLIANATSNSSAFDYCEFRYGGSGRYGPPVISWHDMLGSLYCYGSTAAVRNSVFSDSANYGLRLGSGAVPTCENLAFQNNGSWAVYCDDIASNPLITTCSASGNGRNGIRIPGGTIPVTRAWYKSVPYVVQGDVHVASDRGLTINSGAVVKFDGNSALYVNGNLQAVGTGAEPIYFTSLKDDAAGGDTNGDGGATTPAPGDWREVCVYGATATPSRFEHCVLRYGGNNAYVPAGIGWHDARGNILMKDCAPTIDHCTSSYSGLYGFYGLGACQATISDSTFSGNGSFGIALFDSSYYSLGAPLPITGNTIAGNGYGTHSSAQAAGAFDATNDVSGNTHNVCQIYESTTQTDVTWHRMQGGPVWELVGDVYSLTPNSLTIQAGNVIKFDSTRSLYVTGTLTAVGSGSDRIYFTSIKDDTVGGDSNADGNATAPARGDWSEVLLANDTSSGSQVEYCVLRYGGSNRYGAPVIGWHDMLSNVRCHNSSPQFRYCEFSYSGYDGVFCSAGDAAFESCTFAQSNRMGLNLTGDSDAALNSCAFSGNGEAAIREYTSQGASLAAGYCDTYSDYYYEYWTQGVGWRWASDLPSGPGNFSADPLFVDAAGGDFSLLTGSPCIDTGDPAKTDPDGTRLDVGAYPFGGTISPVDIGSARKLSNGTSVLIVGKVVTAGTTDLTDSRIYIEDESRACGIKIASSAPSKAGDKINVSGKLGVVDGERAVVDAVLSVISSGNPVVDPLFIVNRSVGGGDLGYNPGIPGRTGLNNLCLLVAVQGVVTAIDSGCFWIDDGSAAPGDPGLKVLSSAAVTLGQRLRVVGISSVYTDGGQSLPVIRTRSASDVTTIPQPE